MISGRREGTVWGGAWQTGNSERDQFVVEKGSYLNIPHRQGGTTCRIRNVHESRNKIRIRMRRFAIHSIHNSMHA